MSVSAAVKKAATALRAVEKELREARRWELLADLEQHINWVEGLQEIVSLFPTEEREEE
jgi:anti-sigma factor ChrR (cupin superfamily)